MMNKRVPLFYHLGKLIIIPLFKLYYNPKIVNKEYIPKKGPIVIAGNHKHLYDQFLVIGATNRGIHYMAKKEYFDNKKTKWFFKSAGCISVDRKNHDTNAKNMALDVLKLMPGKKIVVTPGMIELADQEYELNKKFGEYIADSVDEVILVGAKQTKPIQDGLAKKKFPKEKIYILNDVKEAFPLMQKLKEKDTYVLLENDLPDIFNEK